MKCIISILLVFFSLHTAAQKKPAKKAPATAAQKAFRDSVGRKYDTLQMKMQEIRSRRGAIGNGRQQAFKHDSEFDFKRLKVTSVVIENCDTCQNGFIRAGGKLFQLRGGRTGIIKGDSIDVYKGYVMKGIRRYLIVK